MRPGIIKNLFICLLLSAFYLAAGQGNENIDSRASRKIPVSTSEIDSLNKLSRNLVFIDPVKSLEYANRALKLAIDNQYERGTAESYRILSGIYAYSENYSLSIEFNQLAFDIFSQIKDSAGIANCYISLGHISKGLGQKEMELEYHRKSYSIFTRLNIRERMGVTSYNLGESYFNNGDTANARKLIMRSVEINKQLKNLAVLSACWNIIGKLDMAAGKLDKAKGFFLKVLEIKSILGPEAQEIATSESIISLASISKLQNNYREQLAYLTMAEQFCIENNLPASLKEVYLDLIRYYTENNNKSMVLRYLQEFRKVQYAIDSLQLSHIYKLTKNIPVVHELSRQKDRLEQEKIKHLQEIRERNIILVSSFFSILMMSILLISIIRSNKKLKIQKETIESQSRQLEVLNNTKDKFFSIISHDLRSPLNSIKSVSMLLSEYLDKMEKTKIERLARELGSIVENTIRMTENLSSWARIQMKDFKTTTESISITDIISPVYMVYGEMAKHKEITLSCEFDRTLKISGDKNQIEFILRNLVNNAIKFTKRGGSVSIKAAPITDTQLQIIVTDNGIGIPPDKIKELFELGKHRVSYGTEQEKGTGLGMILINDFLKLNNGRIDVESIEGRGTSMRITLPRS